RGLHLDHDFSCSNLTGTAASRPGNTAFPASFGPVRSAARFEDDLQRQCRDPGLKSCGYFFPGAPATWSACPRPLKNSDCSTAPGKDNSGKLSILPRAVE